MFLLNQKTPVLPIKQAVIIMNTVYFIVLANEKRRRPETDEQMASRHVSTRDRLWAMCTQCVPIYFTPAHLLSVAHCNKMLFLPIVWCGCVHRNKLLAPDQQCDSTPDDTHTTDARDPIVLSSDYTVFNTVTACAWRLTRLSVGFFFGETLGDTLHNHSDKHVILPHTQKCSPNSSCWPPCVWVGD
jgi:hypothetical protein